MSANRDFVLSVIDMYKDLACLWKTNDPEYHNKTKRNLALEQLLQLFKTIEPNATKDMVTKKLNSMRGSFRKELNKVRSSEKSGAGASEVHVPKLWYFDKLLFLEDQKVPRTSKSTHSLLDNIPFGYEEPSEIDDTLDTDSQGSSMGSRASTTSTPIVRREVFKRPLSKAEEKISKRIDSPVEKPVLKEKYASFGDHVAEKLRYMPYEMVSISQKLISDVLFYAENRQLNLTSRVLTDYSMPPPSTFGCHQGPSSPSVTSEDSRTSLQTPSNRTMEAFDDTLK